MTKLRLRYQTVEFGNVDIHLCTLRDNQQFDDPDGVAQGLGISSATWPLFGIVWPSAMVLAHFMDSHNTDSQRILEIGCGIGLSSLLLNSRDEDITATDYHPEVAGFLQRNTLLNGDRPINYEQVDWSGGSDELGLFDLIIGSDLLYEEEHAEHVADFIEQHANQQCEVILVDPGRGQKSQLINRMEKRGFSSSIEKPAHTDYLAKVFKGHILRFKR